MAHIPFCIGSKVQSLQLERIPKSVKRFSEKMRVKTKD
ncbi:Hypothetical protein BSPT1_I0639 [Brucella suis bv. 2]|nr:Hypothetical protein BSSP3_I1088 [Brucella suis bv. 2]AIB20739.1 Hypothetical protein BSPT1_I0639 [Brucella suis bv. 2]